MTSTCCSHPWKYLWVNAIGNVTVCPQNHDVLGNINDNHIDEIWFSEKTENLRKKFKNHKYQEAKCEKDCPYLRGCYSEPSQPPRNDAQICPPINPPSVDSTQIYKNNYIKFVEQSQKLEHSVDYYPLVIDIQPVLRCNLDCFMCGQPHSSPNEHNESNYKNLERLLPYASYFRWQGGEVFLSKYFKDYLLNLKNPHPDFTPYVISNLTATSKDYLQRLQSKKKPVKFLCSIDGNKEETYLKVRRKNTFKIAQSNLEFLSKIREDNYFSLTWNFVVMKSTINEIESAINKSTKLGIEINLAPLQGNFTEENIFTFGDKKDILNYYNYFEKLKDKCRTLKVSGIDDILYRLKTHNCFSITNDVEAFIPK